MRSATSTIPKKTKALGLNRSAINFLLCVSFFLFNGLKIFSQDNSPYSRYGLGDIVPKTNIANRGMGGISAAFADPLVVNFSNPASYSSFLTFLEQRSKQPVSGRVVLDVGINFDTRTLKETNPPLKFSSGNAVFSYLQVGIPLRKNWGLSFGLRPVTRIGYKLVRSERLIDPVTGLPIDSAQTEFSGNGGAFLPTIGTGFAIKNLSIGFNVGYMFGKKEYSSKRALFNDSLAYINSNHTSKASFGKLFFNAGLQYKIKVGEASSLTLGVAGNLKQELNASQDIIRETFLRNQNTGDIRLDSVFDQKNVKGKITYPSSITFGFVYEKTATKDRGGFLVGVDLEQTQWNDYLFYGTKDAVQNNWELHAGIQIRPVPKRNYFSNVDYRGGFFIGKDYINVGNKLPLFGVSFGLGLPVPSTNPLSRGQFTKVNLSLEYSKRGNNDNILKEDIFRISLGLNFSDLWFTKRKYE